MCCLVFVKKFIKYCRSFKRQFHPTNLPNIFFFDVNFQTFFRNSYKIFYISTKLWHTGKTGLWMHGLDVWILDAWTLGLWTPERLDFGRLDLGRLDAWTLDVWNLNTWMLGLWILKLWITDA